MRKLLLATAAGLALAASPAAARDGSGYIGVDGGLLFPKDHQVRARVDFTNPAVTDISERRIGEVDFKTGYDVDLNAGYDFGMFRVEGELGYKRAKNKSFEVDGDFLTDVNAGSGQVFTDADFDLDGHTSVLSGMVNGLVDFGGDGGVGASIGGGFGRARVKSLGDSDSAWAWQIIAGVRSAISDNIDIGLKYRYFRTGKLDFADSVAFTGAGTGSGGTAFFDAGSRFSSHSLLASLSYNFAGAALPPPPPPVEVAPPPAPAAPATQTCPDGSVILATDVCPPPPPPPPPPPTPGERGR